MSQNQSEQLPDFLLKEAYNVVFSCDPHKDTRDDMINTLYRNLQNNKRGVVSLAAMHEALDVAERTF